MSVKVLISRKVSKDQLNTIKPFLAELHALAWRSKGYVSGESLINFNNPEERVTISSWQTIEDWENYRTLEEAKQLHSRVDQILGRQTDYTVFINI